ncbi:MAG TPA: winged helix-turn-helix domain-containing protein [Thermoanaerobaculia bacterium]|nr:winged helix-turn-helix domain-containing protein [Thermoanaerobaculia bacterium]
MRTNESGIFRFGELTFDCGSHMLLRNGEEQHLSPKARQLLRMLLLKRPRAVSREEIYDALWPSTFVSETNMTSVVSELRRVLGDHARSAQYIRTVHGFGYAFAADVDTEASAPVAVAVLLCEGERHLLYDGRNTVGRAQDCRVVLAAGTVSRHHAVITIDAGTFVVEDCGSRNGTYVRSEKITRTAVRLQEPIAFGAIQATISRKFSSTIPLPPHLSVPRRHSSSSGSRV